MIDTFLLNELFLKCRGGQIIINNIFGGEKGKQYRWKEVENSNIEYSNKEQIADKKKKNVFNIYHSTQNKKEEEKSKNGLFGLNKEKIILTDTENSKNTDGKYDYDFNTAMENKGDTILSENSNSINSDYRSYEYDSNRMAKNEGGNVLNETGILNDSGERTKDHDSKIIMNTNNNRKANISKAQIVKNNNDSKTRTENSGKQYFNESANISHDYESIFNIYKYIFCDPF